MKKKIAVFAFVSVLAGTTQLRAQNPGIGNGNGTGNGNGAVLIPDSSIEHPEDVGRRAHTNHIISLKGRPVASTGMTPQQAWTAYGVQQLAKTNNTIVIVDAYHYPTAANDLATFSTKMQLPQANFQVVYATPNKQAPSTDCGWAQEAALDIEWAHAMSPNAPIVLVEAASNSYADLFAAVDVANSIQNVGQVSMSWGGSEFSSEITSDSYFHSGIKYFASSGDSGGKTIYPGTSPYVISAGGTTLTLNPDNTRYSETGWSSSGGGRSKYEPRPQFQDGISALVGTSRGAPDLSFDADPNTGVLVYDSTSCNGMSGWMIFGGTSVSAPSLAGIVNAAGNRSVVGSQAELGLIYSHLGDGTSFFDVISGRAGSYKAASGWDFVTGVGSNNGMNGK